jgi:hypothetical protein
MSEATTYFAMAIVRVFTSAHQRGKRQAHHAVGVLINEDHANVHDRHWQI